MHRGDNVSFFKALAAVASLRFLFSILALNIVPNDWHQNASTKALLCRTYRCTQNDIASSRFLNANWQCMCSHSGPTH